MKYVISLFLSAIFSFGLAQDIDLVIHLNSKEVLKHGSAKKIEKTSTSLGPSFSGTELFSTQKSKKVKQLSPSGQVLSELWYDDGELIAKWTYTYDKSTGLKSTMVEERFKRAHYEKSHFSYDPTGRCTGIQAFNKAGKLTYRVELTYQNHLYPVELHLFDSNGNRIGGKEIATYNLEQNTYQSTFLTLTNDTISTYKRKLPIPDTPEAPKAGEEYNERGDLVKKQTSEESYQLFKYKYDDRGNWVKRETFLINEKEKGHSIKIHSESCKRKIKYWKK